MSKYEWNWLVVPIFLAAILACAWTAGTTAKAQEKGPESPGVTGSVPAEQAATPPATVEEQIAALKSDAEKTNAANKVAMDTVWVMITGMLVFFMNLGFATVESGMCRAKNCVNILSKNFIVFAVTTIGFWALGWGLMFGDGNPFVGLQGLFFLGGTDNSPAIADAYKGDYSAINWTAVPLHAKFFFQLVFAGTAATIVSGAVAERIKYLSFIIFSFVMAMAIYP